MGQGDIIKLLKKSNQPMDAHQIADTLELQYSGVAPKLTKLYERGEIERMSYKGKTNYGFKYFINHDKVGDDE